MGSNQKQTGEEAVTLEGELTLPRVEELKSAFLKALVKGDTVSIRFGTVQDVDLSCLQMLCSAHRSAVRMKKKVSVIGTLPKIVRDAAEAAGYMRLKGCNLDFENNCLWISAGVHHG